MRIIITPSGSRIQRNKKYGVGKSVGNDIYFHKHYLECFDFANEITDKLSLIPSNFFFNIIRYNLKIRDISFIFSPNFLDSYFPIVSNSIKVKADNLIPEIKIKIRTFKNNPPIYHHRWLFVKDDFGGFNVETDFKWSKLWVKTPNLIPNRYGFLRHWVDISLPKILKFNNCKFLKDLPVFPRIFTQE